MRDAIVPLIRTPNRVPIGNTNAAGKQRSADNRSADGIHFKSFRPLNKAGAAVQAEQEAADTGKETVQKIGQEPTLRTLMPIIRADEELPMA